MAKIAAAVSVADGQGVFVILEDGRCWYKTHPAGPWFPVDEAVPGSDSHSREAPKEPSQIPPSVSRRDLR